MSEFEMMKMANGDDVEPYEIVDDCEPLDFYLIHHGRDTKEEIVRPLVRYLGFMGITYFFDGCRPSMPLGRTNVDCMQQALSGCRFAAALFSENFCRSSDCVKEVNTVLQRESKGDSDILLPFFFAPRTHPHFELFHSRNGLEHRHGSSKEFMLNMVGEIANKLAQSKRYTIAFGITFSNAFRDEDNDWKTRVLTSKRHIERNITTILKQGSVRRFTGKPEIESETVDGLDRAVALLDYTAEIAVDSVACIEFANLAFRGIQKALQNAGTPPAEMEDVAFIKVWRGSVRLLLEAQSKTLERLFSLLKKNGYELPLADNTILVDVMPVFAVAGRLDSMVADADFCGADAVLWKDNEFEILYPASQHSHGLLVPTSTSNPFLSVQVLEEALPLYEEALAAKKQVLGDKHPNTLGFIHNKATLLQEQGKYDEALPLYKEALAARRQVLGDRHPDTLSSINNMASLLSDQGKLEEALPLYQEALAAQRQVLGDEHPSTLSSINNMALLLSDQGKLEEALPLYQEALAARRQVLGDRHPDTLSSINNMANLLRNQGKLEEALPLYEEALAARRQVLGDRHPDTLSSINNMALLLSDQGKLEEALPLYQEALAARRQVLGDEHPDTLVSINNMGLLLERQGKLSEALPLFREALAGFLQVLGPEHPYSVHVQENIRRYEELQQENAQVKKIIMSAAGYAFVEKNQCDAASETM